MQRLDLPKGWYLADMPQIVKWGSGGTPKAGCAEYYNGSIPWIIIGDLNDGLVTVSEKNITEDGLNASNAKFVEIGSVLLAMYGSIGKLGIAGVRLTTNQAIAFTQQLFGITNRFLFYYLILQKSKLMAMGKGGTQKNISQTVINSLTVPLPPLAEQHRIVAKIDALFSKLDKGVEMLQIIRQQLWTYRQAELKWAFEGRLTGASFSGTRKLEELCFFITKGTTPKKMDMIPMEGEIPFIKVYNLTFNGTLDFSIDPTFVTQDTHNGFLSRSKVFPSDVLMNIVGLPMGKVSIVPDKYSEWNINQAIARFRCNDELNNRYLAHYLLCASTINAISKKTKATAGQFNLTLEICRNIEIPICSIDEQLNIVESIESRLSVCDKLESIVDENLTKAAALRQSILKKAFAGNLVPQDPNDEPAEKLLERIKAEQKHAAAKSKTGEGRKNGP